MVCCSKFTGAHCALVWVVKLKCKDVSPLCYVVGSHIITRTVLCVSKRCVMYVYNCRSDSVKMLNQHGYLRVVRLRPCVCACCM